MARRRRRSGYVSRTWSALCADLICAGSLTDGARGETVPIATLTRRIRVSALGASDRAVLAPEDALTDPKTAQVKRSRR